MDTVKHGDTSQRMTGSQQLRIWEFTFWKSLMRHLEFCVQFYRGAIE